MIEPRQTFHLQTSMKAYILVNLDSLVLVYETLQLVPLKQNISGSEAATVNVTQC